MPLSRAARSLLSRVRMIDPGERRRSRTAVGVRDRRLIVDIDARVRQWCPLSRMSFSGAVQVVACPVWRMARVAGIPREDGAAGVRSVMVTDRRYPFRV